MIDRTVRVLHPTAFVDAVCLKCCKSWNERYEFDFYVPTDGRPWEDQDTRDA